MKYLYEPIRLIKIISGKVFVKVKTKIHYTYRVPKVANDKNVLFIHIPKAAGSTLSLGLYGIQIGHTKAKDYFTYDRESYEKIKSFTFVRHPIKRFESAYYFLMQGGMGEGDVLTRNKYLSKYADINEFIGAIDEKFIRSGEIIHFVPQYEFVYLNNICIVDKVFRLENINKIDLKYEIGFELPKEEKNRTKPMEIVQLNRKSIDKLKDLYAVDFYKFGYNLEDEE